MCVINVVVVAHCLPSPGSLALSVCVCVCCCFRLHSISNYLHIFCLGALPRQTMRTTKQNTNIIFTSFNLMRSKRQEAEAALIKNKASLLFALFYILFHLLLPPSSSFSLSLPPTHTHTQSGHRAPSCGSS